MRFLMYFLSHNFKFLCFRLQLLVLGLAKMVCFQGTETADHLHRSSVDGEISAERDSESKIQHLHLSTVGAVRAVPVLLKSVLPDHGCESIYSGH